jgi:pyruvate dehydrogenase E1 component
MTTAETFAPAEVRLDTIRRIEERVLWLATAQIDFANHHRSDPSGLKVGGHQASCASMTSIATALWFHALRSGDRVSIKPHASPVLHAIEFLLGDIGPDQLQGLRRFGGLQSYPSRTKDPKPADYSTGSVGIGATAPIWGAIARRYVRDHLREPGRGRQYSLLGDAELDEGAAWEAVLDPIVAELGEVVWVVDINRQSLDRVIPIMSAVRFEAMFAAAGWQVITVKYGALLQSLFDRPGGEALRRRIDAMTNPEYQRLLRHPADRLRTALAGEGPDAAEIARLVEGLEDTDLLAAVRNLGGHDLPALTAAFGQIDDSRPTVILAYTIKGRGLPVEGHPQNHSALLTSEQMVGLAQRLGIDPADPWQDFSPQSPEGQLCREVALRLARPRGELPAPPLVPRDLGRTPQGTGSTQAALGRTVLDLLRAAPEVGRRIVTVSPDVSSSTNLAGWVNKVGVWSPADRPDWFSDDPETILHWRETPSGQHIELGIAETNLVGMIGELGATWSRWDEPLFPIGVLYDPFVGRALEPWWFGIYSGGQSLLVGTPSGVTLAAEGGAHQSIVTPSIGLELPGLLAYEPAFAIDTEWCLLEALSRMGRPGGTSAYLRLSTRPVDQTLAAVPTDPAARERRRRLAVAGAVPLVREEAPDLTLVGMGALVPETLEAAGRLRAMGHRPDVVGVTSPGLLYQAVDARGGRAGGEDWILDAAFPADRARPMVTVLDGHPHTLAFLAGINRVRSMHLGVRSFGQSGDLASVYRAHGIDTDSIVRAALDLLG